MKPGVGCLKSEVGSLMKSEFEVGRFLYFQTSDFRPQTSFLPSGVLNNILGLVYFSLWYRPQIVPGLKHTGFYYFSLIKSIIRDRYAYPHVEATERSTFRRGRCFPAVCIEIAECFKGQFNSSFMMDACAHVFFGKANG